METLKGRCLKNQAGGSSSRRASYDSQFTEPKGLRAIFDKTNPPKYDNNKGNMGTRESRQGMPGRPGRSDGCQIP